MLPIRHLQCCICGARTSGRQWHNRDTGYGGPCDHCVAYVKTRTTPAEMRSNYGIDGVHYNVSTTA